MFQVTTPWREDTGIAVWELEVPDDGRPSLVAMTWLGNIFFVWSAGSASTDPLAILWPLLPRASVPPYQTTCRRVRCASDGRIQENELAVEAMGAGPSPLTWPVDAVLSVGHDEPQLEVRAIARPTTVDGAAGRFAYEFADGDLVGAVTVAFDGLETRLSYTASPQDAEPRRVLQTLVVLRSLWTGATLVVATAADRRPVVYVPGSASPPGPPPPMLADEIGLAQALVRINEQLGTRLAYPARPSPVMLHLAARLAGAVGLR